MNTYLDTQRISWLVLIYGSLLAARGDIGILAGKLSTALNLETVRPAYRGNTEEFKNLLVSIITIITVDALVIGCLTYGSNLVLFPKELRVLNPTLFFVIPLVVLYGATMISIGITTTLGFGLYRKKLNLDLYIVPLTNSLNNIIMTVLYVAMVLGLKPWGKELQTDPLLGEYYPAPTQGDLFATYLTIIPVALLLGGVIYLNRRRRKDKRYTKIVKEAVPMILLGMVCGVVTGMLLTKMEPVLVKYPQLWITLPALLVLMEDQSNMTGNSLTTRFAKKEYEPKFRTIRKPRVLLKFGGIGTGGVVVTGLIALIGILVRIKENGLTLVLGGVVLLVVLANILSYVLLMLVMFGVIVLSYKRGVDPDNFLIAFFSSFADMVYVAMLLLLFAITLGIS